MILTSPRIAIAAALGGCLVASSVTAQDGFERALPSDTVAYFSFPDINKSLTQMRSAPLAKMWHENEVQDFLADGIAMLEMQIQMGMAKGKEMHEAGMLPIDPNELTKLRINSMGVALTKIGLFEFGNDVIPALGVIAHADLGETAPIWQKAINSLIELLQDEAGDNLTVERSEAQGATITRILAPMDGFPMSLNLAFKGNELVIGTIGSEFDTFLAGLTETPETSLVTNAEFTRSMQRVEDGDSAMELYVRPMAFVDFALDAVRIAEQQAPDFPKELSSAGLERVVSVLGLRSLHGMTAASSYVDGRSVSKSFVASPEQERKGLFAAKTADVDLNALRWIPNDAAGFSIGSFDMSGIYDTLVEAMNAYDEDLAGMLLGRLAGLEEKVGVSLQRDVFGAFGKRYVRWSLPMASFSSAPESALILEIANQEGLLNALEKLGTATNFFSLEKNERRGITVYQIAPNLNMGGGGLNMLAMFTPTFAFKDGYLVGAFSTGDIKRAFKRMARGEDAEAQDDIRGNAEFRPYLEKLPGQGVKALSFTDWKAEFESFYQVGTTVLAFVPLDPSIPIDLSLLPDSTTLTQHLCGTVSWSQVTPDGFSTTSIGPWGPEMMMIAGAAIGAGAGTLATLAPRQFR